MSQVDRDMLRLAFMVGMTLGWLIDMTLRTL